MQTIYKVLHHLVDHLRHNQCSFLVFDSLQLIYHSIYGPQQLVPLTEHKEDWSNICVAVTDSLFWLKD